MYRSRIIRSDAPGSRQLDDARSDLLGVRLSIHLQYVAPMWSPLSRTSSTKIGDAAVVRMRRGKRKAMFFCVDGPVGFASSCLRGFDLICLGIAMMRCRFKLEP